MASKNTFPYEEIFSDVVRSIMAAQLEMIQWLGKRGDDEIPNASLNRHFSWLTQVYPDGVNRHLFDGGDGNYSLKGAPLRGPGKHLSSSMQNLLEKRLPLPATDVGNFELSGKKKSKQHVVQPNATRISQLLRASFRQVLEIEEAGGSVTVVSPLKIAADFLTVANLPGSRGYVEVAIRNYIFESLRKFPADLAPLPAEVTFSQSDVHEAFSHVVTSTRVRHDSRGFDPLPPLGRSRAGGVLRHFFAASGYFMLRFKNVSAASDYLSNAQAVLTNAPFEFIRSPYVEHLPETGEIINRLWGLPVPIRGGDILFRGGLKVAARGGLVMGIHGGPGSGKTSIALALAAYLAPFGVRTLFLSGEEDAIDLASRIDAILPDDAARRLSFFTNLPTDWLTIQEFPLSPQEGLLASLSKEFSRLAKVLAETSEITSPDEGSPRPCRAIVVLDGLHDLLMSQAAQEPAQPSKGIVIGQLRKFIEVCRELKAVVILTTGEDWEGDKSLDYLVDVALRLTHENMALADRKPERRVAITKARHQLCSVGTHGIQIGGAKGLRFSPQIAYQLASRSVWRKRLPDPRTVRPAFRRALEGTNPAMLPTDIADWPKDLKFVEAEQVWFSEGSNIFLNGEGSGGKAALALKLALSPVIRDGELDRTAARTLIVSFLYPMDYYENIRKKLVRIRHREFPQYTRTDRINVVHLYPGHYQPDYLFNRIEWLIESAELNGRPYNTVIIDGLHNVFLQFPELARYTLIWPQLFSALQSRPLTTITTHTHIVMDSSRYDRAAIDDQRSEPLRHSLVQKTDFRIEVEPVAERGRDDELEKIPNVFSVRTASAINQPIPNRPLYWSREKLVFVREIGIWQPPLPFARA